MILSTQSSKIIAAATRYFGNRRGTSAEHTVTIAFAPTVTVSRPSEQRLTILGLDVTTMYEGRRRLTLWPFRLATEEVRQERALLVEALRDDGGSVGGSVFVVNCDHRDLGNSNYACAQRSFANHTASAVRIDGLGVDREYRRQGLATAMYRLAAAYARSHGILLVPATHVLESGKRIWRALIASGHEMPAEYVARVVL